MLWRNFEIQQQCVVCKNPSGDLLTCAQEFDHCGRRRFIIHGTTFSTCSQHVNFHMLTPLRFIQACLLHGGVERPLTCWRDKHVAKQCIIHHVHGTGTCIHYKHPVPSMNRAKPWRRAFPWFKLFSDARVPLSFGPERSQPFRLRGLKALKAHVWRLKGHSWGLRGIFRPEETRSVL